MPSRPVRSAAALALATSAGSFAYVGTAAPAQAAGYDGYCRTSSGVTVVVDFRELGGGIAVRCAPVGSGASGVQALQAAGIPVEGTRQYGLAFVCRLYGKPSATTELPGGYHETCGRTPPPNAHWWYTQAPNGGSWSASGDGASSSHVIPGGFEGWAFSEGGTNYSPRFTPTRPAAPKPPATHTTSPPPAPPRRTTSTAPHTSKTIAPTGNSTSSSGSPPKSTASSSAAHPATKRAAENTRSKSAAHSTSSKAKHNKESSSSPAVAGGSSGGPTNVAGAPMTNSDDLIKHSEKSSGINATTVVGGIVLAALVVGGGAVAIIRRRTLG